MRKLILIPLLTLTAPPAIARLGDTPAQCEARYGKPLATRPDGTTIHKKDHITIHITYHLGAASSLIYRPDKPKTNTTPQAPPQLTPTDIARLLRDNQQNAEWKKDPDESFGHTLWNRTDHHAFAKHNPATGELHILNIHEATRPKEKPIPPSHHK